MSAVDAVVVGSGPNGLAAAITMARAGLSVTVLEGDDLVGGGCRTQEATLPGFRHDLCSIAHPLVMASPFFRHPSFDGLRERLRQPEVPFAHPLGGETATAAHRSVDETAATLGADAAAYRRLFSPLVEHADRITDAVLAPLRTLPDHPVTVGRFGLAGLLPVQVLSRRFRSAEARALLAGVSAHSMSPLTAPLTAGVRAAAHPAGARAGLAGGRGRQCHPDRRHGRRARAPRWHRLDRALGRITRRGATGDPVLFDTSPKGLAAIAGDALPTRYTRALGRFRYGPGVCKVDWALSGPVPWSAAVCRRAGTLHVGGTAAEVAASEAGVWAGRHPARPYCLVVQPGVADPSRAPAGRQTLWAYCHVPSGSTVDMTGAIERQIERFAPGFSDLILARATRTAAQEELADPNYVGGAITGGAATLRQTMFRPTMQWNPYRTPLAGVYLCSASTPPGAGVHGMCGVFAARNGPARPLRGRVTLRRSLAVRQQRGPRRRSPDGHEPLWFPSAW